MELKLHVGQLFQTWLDAEKFLTQYSLIKVFSIRQKQTERLVENGIEIIKKITWKCCFSGKYQPKKVINPENQRNKQSKCTNCQWHVNGNLSKSSSNISFTTVIDEHNHQMISSPSTTIAKHRKLDENIILPLDNQLIEIMLQKYKVNFIEKQRFLCLDIEMY